MLHQVVDLEVAQVEDAAEAFCLAAIDDAFARRKLDGAAQFVMGEDVGFIVGAGRRDAHHTGDEELDDARDRAQKHDQGRHDGGNRQGEAVGKRDRVGLGQDLAEDHDEER